MPEQAINSCEFVANAIFTKHKQKHCCGYSRLFSITLGNLFDCELGEEECASDREWERQEWTGKHFNILAHWFIQRVSCFYFVLSFYFKSKYFEILLKWYWHWFCGSFSWIFSLKDSTSLFVYHFQFEFFTDNPVFLSYLLKLCSMNASIFPRRIWFNVWSNRKFNPNVLWVELYRSCIVITKIKCTFAHNIQVYFSSFYSEFLYFQSKSKSSFPRGK